MLVVNIWGHQPQFDAEDAIKFLSDCGVGMLSTSSRMDDWLMTKDWGQSGPICDAADDNGMLILFRLLAWTKHIEDCPSTLQIGQMDGGVGLNIYSPYGLAMLKQFTEAAAQTRQCKQASIISLGYNRAGEVGGDFWKFKSPDPTDTQAERDAIRHAIAVFGAPFWGVTPCGGQRGSLSFASEGRLETPIYYREDATLAADIIIPLQWAQSYGAVDLAEHQRYTLSLMLGTRRTNVFVQEAYLQPDGTPDADALISAANLCAKWGVHFQLLADDVRTIIKLEALLRELAHILASKPAPFIPRAETIHLPHSKGLEEWRKLCVDNRKDVVPVRAVT